MTQNAKLQQPILSILQQELGCYHACLGQDKNWRFDRAAERIAELVNHANGTKAAGKRLIAEDFWKLFHNARAAAIAELGERWVFTSADNCCWLEVPNKLRRFRGPKGTIITNPGDIRAPAPRFWPSGMIPREIAVRPDFPRERKPLAI